MAWPRRLTTLLATALLAILCIFILLKPPQVLREPGRLASANDGITRTPTLKPPLPTAPPIKDNFPLAASAERPNDLPPIPAWNKPRHVAENTPLFIGFTRNWLVLQQAVVSYITAGWPPEDIYVVDNTGTFNSNKKKKLTLQNPFYLDHRRLTDVLGVNVLTTPTLLSFAQLQNFFLFQSIEHGWDYYFWSHMDVLALPDERMHMMVDRKELPDEEKPPFMSLYHRAVEVLRDSIKPSYGKWGIRFFAYDRLALVNVEAYVNVGAWDTFIPFYGTDCDMHERVAMGGWKMEDAFIGYIYDMGPTLPDLRVLYREDDEKSRKLCAERNGGETDKHGLGDCRFKELMRELDGLQREKQEREGGRNFWQAQQMGGQDEPFYRDPLGFDQAIMMSNENGQDVMGEKWGHQGCNIREYGLDLHHQWRVQHDHDYNPPSVSHLT